MFNVIEYLVAGALLRFDTKTPEQIIIVVRGCPTRKDNAPIDMPMRVSSPYLKGRLVDRISVPIDADFNNLIF